MQQPCGGGHDRLHWLMWKHIQRFPRSCISCSHLHGEQYEVRNGFGILWLKSPFKLAASLALFPRENMRGRTSPVRELRVWNIFHIQRNTGEKKRSNPFFYLCLRTEKSIFNYTCKVDRGLTYQKCWVQGWRLNMERGSVYYYLGGINVHTETRDWNLCPQPALDLEANSVKSDPLGQ